MFDRTKTKKIRVGNISIGGHDDIVIQSMCNTKSENATTTINQILELEKVGCELVRITIPNEASANNIELIKSKIHIPLVADIHFDYKLAIMSAERGIDKIRINPGNICDESKVKLVIDICKKKGIPIRVGVNSGSVSKDILAKYNGRVTDDAIVESLDNEIRILEKYDFDDIVISVKSSNVLSCINCYKKVAEKYNYPLHIGVTEAGTIFSGTIKSSIGLGILISDGIGDTMRVSLSDNPINEIRVAKKILKTLGIRKEGIEIISCPTCGRTNIDIVKISNSVEDKIDKLVADGLIDKKLNIKVAIMGCAVNGPGEAKEADIGIAGGNGEGLIFKKGEIIKKVKEEELEEQLINHILEMKC